MKTPRFLIILFSLVAVALAESAFALGEDVSPEASEEVRVVAAKAKLSKESDTVVLYAKGLCCPSCAIGIRKMVSKLDFVDRKRFNKGVDLDTKNQLVTVAITTGGKVDHDSLAKAIDKAGYDPALVYFLEGDQVASRSLALN